MKTDNAPRLDSLAKWPLTQEGWTPITVIKGPFGVLVLCSVNNLNKCRKSFKWQYQADFFSVEQLCELGAITPPPNALLTDGGDIFTVDEPVTLEVIHRLAPLLSGLHSPDNWHGNAGNTLPG